MRDPTFPSRLPGWSLMISALVAGLLGTHVSMVAFAHYALGNTESWIWDLASGEGWQVGAVLARCTSTTLFANSSLPSTADYLWCRQWWLMFHRWTGGPGGWFFGATMLLIVVGGASAYLFALTRLVPEGPARRRTTTYATRDELRSFLRPRGTPPEAMADAGALPLDRKSTRLNSSHVRISYAVFCLKQKTVRDARGVASPSTKHHKVQHEP